MTMHFAMRPSKTRGSSTPEPGTGKVFVHQFPDRNDRAAKQMPRSERPAGKRGTEIARKSNSNQKQSPQGTRVNQKEEQMFRTKKRNEKGFTLIELMIVVVIIGILAALAIPRFMRATTKSKQSEAKQVLKQIYTMQHAYRQEYNTYALNGTTASAVAAQQTAFGRIGVDIMSTARYTYTLVAAAATFTATATSGVLDDDATVDTWTINENGDLLCTSDDAIL